MSSDIQPETISDSPVSTGPVKLRGEDAALDQVLIAEDDPMSRRVLRQWLEEWDYQVTATENGLEAWEILQQENAPQMVILDWMMPGLDGIELCRRIRERDLSGYRYIVLLTAKDQAHDVVAGLEAGADDYLTKPFDVNELKARVRSGRRILELQCELIQARESLRFEAEHDRLTGLWNRGAILDLLKKELQRKHRTGDALTIAIADLDHFKEINDSYGHLTGDAVLLEVGRRLEAAVRAYDSVGRYGGEEFLVVIPGCDAAGAVLAAERLRSGMCSEPVKTRDGPLPVTLSLGTVTACRGEDESIEAEEMLRAADVALYRAKANGRNRAETGTLG